MRRLTVALHVNNNQCRSLWTERGIMWEAVGIRGYLVHFGAHDRCTLSVLRRFLLPTEDYGFP